MSGAQNGSFVENVDPFRNQQDLYKSLVHLTIRKEASKFFLLASFDGRSRDAAEEVGIVLQGLEVALGSDSERKPHLRSHSGHRPRTGK